MLTVLCAALMAVHAQTLDCSDTVKAALSVTGTRCADMKHNTACFGNGPITIKQKAGTATVAFYAPGDTIAVDAIDSLEMGTLDAARGTKQWGVAYLRIQANLPNTAAGQYVTMVVFGGVKISDASKAASTGGAAYQPMQAVYLQTGVGSPMCHNAPTSGLLIQTPKGLQKVNLEVNHIKLSVGSTVFITFAPSKTNKGTATLTATPDKNNTRGTDIMRIQTIEGDVKVISGGITQEIKGGQESEIPVDQNDIPDGELGAPQNSDPQITTAFVDQGFVDDALIEPIATMVPTDEPSVDTPIPTDEPTTDASVPTDVPPAG